MSDHRNKPRGANAAPPAAPNRDFEIRVKKNPGDEDAQADLGSDESMDASDPSSAAQPGSNNDPVPSSGFPEKDAKK
jgi:hypothetical protein